MNMMEQQPHSQQQVSTTSPPQHQQPHIQHQPPLKPIAIAPVTQQQQPQPQQQLPNQLKVTTNFNFQYDDNGNLGRVDVSKALCYQSQEVANNVVTKKVVVMHQKKTPILLASPNVDQCETEQQQQLQPHYVDCNNNNLSSPQMPCIDTTTPQSPQIYAPKNINPQFIQPPFLNHHPNLNWIPNYNN